MARALSERPSAGILFALISAGLFGASTPVAKLLLGNGIDAWLLAGLLYSSSGLGLAGVIAVRRLFGSPVNDGHLLREPREGGTTSSGTTGGSTTLY